jgi:prevent-host-death family protein
LLAVTAESVTWERDDSSANPFGQKRVDRIGDWSYNKAMKTIAAAKFKEQCLKLLEEVGREGIVITKHGKPVARLVPINEPHSSMIGKFKGKVRVNGDLLSTGAVWDAQP